MENTNQAISEPLDQPLVALIGPTNAGKSTLFNRLTGSWQAITAREESTTRDRVYGEVEWQGHNFTVVDTGGFADDDSDLYKKIHDQTIAAVNEADLILFVYDAAAGLNERDRVFLNSLRGRTPIWLVGNKVDSVTREAKVEKLDNLGLPYHEVSAISGRGSGDLLEAVCQFLPKSEKAAGHKEPLIALVGRPNVGKSTLLNALVEEERAVVSPVAGTTRDVVTAELELDGAKFLLADTAGVRRRGSIEAGAEKFSVKRTLSAIEQADAVIVLVSAPEGTTRGDLHLIYFAHQLEKPLLVIFNKIDLTSDDRLRFHHHLAKFDQLAISALKKENITKVAEWLKNLPVT
ncbi:MAG TPA: ribosome biogenesis GTPase Der [Candidatus Saccharimonadales bacterium]|nr:ribosome biogenesis GTPase Der [Candidatus Saccharimonadales bacterium]